MRRLPDPFRVQAFGCVLGFDWHSSAVTADRHRRAQRGPLHDLGVQAGIRGPSGQ
ncbi:MAG: DUF763 domain-containing protein [bacterium]